MTGHKNTNKKTQTNTFFIQVSVNGPYLVSGGIPLLQKSIDYNVQLDSCKWQDDKIYPQQKNYALCRCGQSCNKPFCDGTHSKVSFDGTEIEQQELYSNKAVRINGPDLTLTDAKDLCASARFCHRAGGIWSLILTSDKPDDKRIAIEEAADCPSGRLIVYDKKTKKAIEPSFKPSLVLIEDPFIHRSGPIWVRGGIPIQSAQGTIYEIRNRVTLCRCGKSHNKPFCDSSHYPDEQ